MFPTPRTTGADNREQPDWFAIASLAFSGSPQRLFAIALETLGDVDLDRLPKVRSVPQPPIRRSLRKGHYTVNVPAALLESATRDLYRRNGFRITGLPVGTSDRDIARHLEAVKMAERLGGPTVQTRHPFPLELPPDNFASREAAQRLRQSESRLVDAFFWFWPLDPQGTGSDHAIELLIEGRTDEAEQQWTSEREYIGVAQHNLAVLHHLRALDMEAQKHASTVTSAQDKHRLATWSESLRCWSALFQNTEFWHALPSMLENAARLQVTIGDALRLRDGLPGVLAGISAAVAVSAVRSGNLHECRLHSEIVVNSGLPMGEVRAAFRDAASSLVRAIEERRQKAIASFELFDDRTIEIASELLEDITPQIESLTTLLLPDDPGLVSAASAVATSVRDGVVGYANSTEDWRGVALILKRAARLPCSALVRDRLSVDLRTVVGNRFRQEVEKILASNTTSPTQLNQVLANVLPDLTENRDAENIDAEVVDSIAQAIANLAVSCANMEDFAACRLGLEAARELAATPTYRAGAEQAIEELNALEERHAVAHQNSTTNWVLAAAGLVVFVVFLVFSKSPTNPSQNITSDNTPQTRPRQSRTVDRATQPTPRPQPESSRSRQLKAEIAIIRAAVAPYELELPLLLTEIENLETELEASSSLIEMERGVVEAEILQPLIDIHNERFGEYEAKFAEYNRKYSEYEALCETGNAKVAEYNALQ